MPYDGYLGDFDTNITYFERMLSDRSSGLDLPAAVILEVVQGEGGLNTASAGLAGEWQSCATDRLLLIVDDVQLGCGRTGPFFSFEPPA